VDDELLCFPDPHVIPNYEGEDDESEISEQEVAESIDVDEPEPQQAIPATPDQIRMSPVPISFEETELDTKD
jgi:hypothetical protein